VDADLDTLVTALYGTADDLIKAWPGLAPARPAVGIAPQLTDAELVTLAVIQAHRGFVSERRFLRYARRHLRHLLVDEQDLITPRPGQTLIADKNYFGQAFEADVAAMRLDLLRPARAGEPARPGAQLFKPLRRTIESINQTLKGQLDLERHGGRSTAGVIARVLQRILALTTAIWLNDKLGLPVHRSLIAYDH
jgi:hypothetical protein